MSPSKRKTAESKNRSRLCGMCDAPFKKLEEHYITKHNFERKKATKEAKKQPFAIGSSDEDEEYYSCPSTNFLKACHRLSVVCDISLDILYTVYNFNIPIYILKINIII